MSLIKCPSCAKEVSDKAENCVNCGFNIGEYRRRLKEQEKAQQKIECPECKTLVSGNEEACPKCGYPIKRDIAIKDKEIPEIAKKMMLNKKKVLLGISVLIIVIAIIVVFIKMTGNNELSVYSDYLGKYAKDLPSDVKEEEIFTGLVIAKQTKQILGYEGEVSYYYQHEAAGDCEPEQISIVAWQGNDNSYTEEEINKFLDYLTKIYGKFDESYESENKFSDIDNKGYVWKNEDGVRVELRTDVEYTKLSINWYPKDA
ncbi:zinc ribbon domain-containing protein [Bariatricus massiliensis]|uniref:Zinc ribbon domain-containing protein n=1 Tax=Bariatricus massiliensis TaxID=1745713 RepID=A0ABS8DLI7_9FIRM|nr:zinc ribbon domain-containing protein [Bariatricus massiliensis]MCB7306131.1 zinc ribbon domain-containing protein [Bariatricus massiliensis]MCB7376660.1 zinc ribbon domain-containing protein [Bariatricus massiliensis]MCB7389318.1 zinc ribbon domain-containing protein [Bariatricus massiliensis]MCB7413495.1 zinc ribbon domain-containing protein [Bariatricus massiliensis]MCQ5254334.1 zinc ribbon domain-containing protein [Bariatricus massiliensis]